VVQVQHYFLLVNIDFSFMISPQFYKMTNKTYL